MSTQTRYPNKTNQVSSKDSSEWNDLDNVFIDDWESLAVCQLSSGQKPNSFIVSDFNFHVPGDCKIHAIDIRLDFHKDSSQNSIELNPPKIRLVNIKKKCESKPLYSPSVSPIERSVLFDGSRISPSEINSADFGVEVIFDENKSEFSGDLFFDFIRFQN